MNGRLDKVSGLLYSDICFALAQLPAHCDITLILHKSAPEFFLQGGTDGIAYRVNVTDVEFETRKFQLSDRLNITVEKQLSMGAIIPFTQLAATNQGIHIKGHKSGDQESI